MSEALRSFHATIEIDTNKQTTREEFADPAEAVRFITESTGATLDRTAQVDSWSDIAARDGWDDVDDAALRAAAADGLAWALLDQTMDLADREPSASAIDGAHDTAQRILAARAEATR